MSVVYGMPSSTSGSEKVASWNECLRNCYEQKDCVLVYLASPTSICLLFRFGNITSINKLPSSSPQIVAFRTFLSSSTCPDSSDSALNSQSFSYTSGQSFYNSTITSTTSSYLITYSTITCPINSKLFIRDTTVICFGVRFFQNFACAVQPNASALCGESGGMSMTGPANQEEYDYLTTLMTKDSLSQAGCTFCSSSQTFIWIDGNTVNVTKQFIFEDPTHNGYSNYPLYPGTPRGTRPGYCFYLVNTIDDYPCDMQGTGGCFIGALCRIKPI